MKTKSARPGKPAQSVRTARPKPPLQPPKKPGEPTDRLRRRAAKILALLRRLYPDADCALKHQSALHLLVATILSAQCTDERVNQVTPVLFARYPRLEDLADASTTDLESIIKSTGFFRNKTKSILGAARTILDRFEGMVPDNMEDLLQLPGVARKTANVILGTWYKKNEGIVVDTHIGRLAHRLKLTWRSKDDKDAVKIEQDLMEIVPRDDWTFLGHALIWHGRRICSARRPACDRCTLSADCPSAFQFDAGPNRSGKATGPLNSNPPRPRRKRDKAADKR